MSELIEREPLLENWKLLRRTRAATATPEAMSMMLRNLIKDAPAVDAAKVVRGEWVSVEDRLPPDEAPVLAYYGFERGEKPMRMFIAVLTYFAFDPAPHWQYETPGVFVTHWMPLPEPPRG